MKTPIKKTLYNDIHYGIFKTGGSFEVMFKYDQEGEEWSCFGGSVGYTTANFKTMEECDNFLTKGFKEDQSNPDIWLDMVAI